MQLETLQALCLSFPGVTEDIKWEHDLCFSVGGKMFCVASLEPPFTFSLKATPAEFEELIARPHIEPAPYLARYHWVLFTDPAAFTQNELPLVKQSYDLIKSKLPKKALVAAGLV
jgi:predicted DNA-binding protein (MmcQ/YjbR family)